MTPEDLQLVKECFLAAADMPPAEREEWLAGRELSDAVLRQVRLQLRMFESEPPELDPVVRRAPAPEPELVDGYRLLEVLGEGGFGTVWRAEQLRPVQRQVAVKVIKVGMDTRQVVGRFEAERQALAQMDHPHIAKVLDAGATESGRPYFAMELVEGAPITEFCDRHQLDTGERLELLAKVCDAVQHAHRRGLIHRDLKPGNVLVTDRDGVAHPKVIDFGVAKATAAAETQRTLFTERNQLIGTPEYMAPEQAEEALDVDTRADVYSLGVLLYELLTGTLPFDVQAARERGYLEMLRVIREQQPARPSTRVTTACAEREQVARHRRARPDALRRSLRGDLDWIAMRALEKRREDRYGSAAELAADLTRHLRSEPVLAGPRSRSYHLRRFVRKHRVTVSAMAVVLLAIVAGAGAAIWGFFEADAQRLRAERARDRAVQAQRTAESAVALITEMVGQTNPDIAGRPEPTATDILQRVTDRVQSTLAGEPRTESLVRVAVGKAAMALGRVRLAERNLRRAVSLLEDRSNVSLAEAYAVLWPYWLIAGQTPGPNYPVAIRRLRATLVEAIADGAPALRQALGALLEVPARASGERALERVLVAMESAHAVEPLRWQMLADLLVLQCRPSNVTDRGRWFETALRIYGERLALEPENSRVVAARVSFVWHLLGQAEIDYARAADIAAETLQLTASRMPERHWFRAATRADLAYCLIHLERFEEAEQHIGPAVQELSAALGESARMTLWARMTQLQWFDLQGRGDEAAAQELRDRFGRLLGRDPGITATEWACTALGPGQEDLAEKLRALDACCRRPAEAEPLLREVLGICRERLQNEDARAVAAASLIHACCALLRGADGSPKLLLEAFDYAVTVLSTADEFGATSPLYHLGQCQLATGDLQAAARTAQRCVDESERTGFHLPVWATLQARCRFALGERTDAIQQARQAYETHRPLLGEDNANVRAAFGALVRMLRRNGQGDAALTLCRDRLARIAQGFPAPTARRHTLELMLHVLGRDSEVAEPLQDLLRDDPASVANHALCSQLAAFRYDATQARLHAAKVVEAAPRNVRELAAAAERFRRLGARDAAVDHGTRALDIEPTPLRRCQLARIQLTFGDHERALRLVQSVLAADPQHALGHGLMAWIHLQRGELDLAWQAARRRADLDGDREMLARVGLARNAPRVLADFEAAANRAVRPCGDGFWFDHALALHRAGQPDRALELLRQLVADWPHEACAWNALARFLTTTSAAGSPRSREATAAARRATEISRHTSPAVLATLAEALARQGELDEARQVARELREVMGPGDAAWLTAAQSQALIERLGGG